MAAAFWISPLTWLGGVSQTHIHVWVAVLLGGTITAFPLFLIRFNPGKPLTRHVIAVAQMLWSALLIHLLGGRMETHFHVFGSLAFIAFYRDVRVLGTATTVVVLDHYLRGVFFPQSAYGALTISQWRIVEHAGWVVFLDTFLIVSIRNGLKEMRTLAQQHAELGQSHLNVEEQVQHRTQQLAQQTDELRSIQRSLSASEERLARAVRGTSDGLWDWNLKIKEIWHSPRLLELLGYSDGDLRPTFDEWFRLVHCDDRGDMLAAIRKHLDTDASYNVQCRMRTKEGEWKWCRIRGACVRDQAGEPISMAGTLQDISEHKAQAAQLAEQAAKIQQKQKLEAVGSLAGGIAHEFNNLLQAMLGYARFAQDGLDEQEQRFLDLTQVLKAGDRAATLTSQLLCFSRNEQFTSQAVEVVPLMQDLAKLLKPVISEQITIRMELPQELPPVLTDSSGLQQALLNLCLNARDAMPDGGELLIRAESMNLSPRYCEIHALDRPGQYICFLISDTGTGMSPEQASRIFEPFYTTKEVGKGTGLGLAMVHGFVERHHGVINVYSEPGAGTTFRMCLPIATENLELTNSTDRPAPKGGSETILIAEDEPMVRAVAERILKEAGYRVLTAVDGREAVDLFARHQHEIALTLLDVVMPRMTGREAYEQIRQIDPDSIVMFCTGYDPETSQADSFHQDSLMLVQKPYDPDDLLEAIRILLDQQFIKDESLCTV
ncbi:MAG: PAS domain-containing protein [Rhodopirellula sp.]|nr:PAS domain-containing protein [Rhodopirellula sp.]